MMNFLLRLWKIHLSLILVAAAFFLHYKVYMPEQEAYQKEVDMLNMTIKSLEKQITDNEKYKGVQALLEPNQKALTESRLDLYQNFPVELLEEDQILYILYLEEKFGTEISFAFNTAQPIATLSDGAQLCGLTLIINYESTYKGFKEMLEYLSSDSRIASVQYATIDYDNQQDLAVGSVAITLYTMNTKALEYQPPLVEQPETGKDNIYESDLPNKH
jgi:hypothetical protein